MPPALTKAPSFDPLTMPVLLLSLVAGAAQAVGFAPLGWWPMSLVVAALWLWGIRNRTGRKAIAPALMFSWGLYLGGISWVYVSVHHFGGAPAWMAIILVVFLALYLASYLALSIVFAWSITTVLWQRLLLALPAAWFLGEQVRGWVLGGFPWLSSGYALTDTPGADGVLAIFGVMGLGAVWWLLAGALVLAFSEVGRKRRTAALAVMALIIILFVALPDASRWTTAKEEPLDVALIQGNIPQHEKWDPENLLPTLQLYTRLTAEQSEADLVIWPEVSIPAARHNVEAWFEKWQADAESRGQTVFAGVITRVDGHAYNTVYALGQSAGRYVKQHLVPFGEYFPVPSWVRPVVDWLELPFSDIRTDLESDPFLYAGQVPLYVSVCFEDVFPSEFARATRDSELLVNVTNDAWFVGSLGPDQHLQIAQARAAETGRPLLRVANTGISAVISPQGQILEQLGWGVRNVLNTEIVPRTGETPYMRWQDWPLVILAFAVLIAMRIKLFSSHP